jgi:membrane-associated phospholipid phosphatase
VKLSVAVFFILAVHLMTVPAVEPSVPGLVDEGARGGLSYHQAWNVSLGTGYLKGFVSDTRDVLLSPSAWHPPDWIKFSLIVGITTALADEEEDVQTWVQEKRTSDTGYISRLVKPFGDGKYTLPALVTLYGIGRFTGSTRARRAALLGVESFVVTGIFTETIKHTSHKHRPRSGDLENITWDGPRASRANLSFPSGHAASAFAVATVVASEYRDSAVVPPLTYGVAALCALSRVHDNAHWISDVIIGSAIGHFTAKAIVRLHGGRSDVNLKLQPVLNDRIAGLSLSYRF